MFKKCLSDDNTCSTSCGSNVSSMFLKPSLWHSELLFHQITLQCWMFKFFIFLSTAADLLHSIWEQRSRDPQQLKLFRIQRKIPHFTSFSSLNAAINYRFFERFTLLQNICDTEEENKTKLWKLCALKIGLKHILCKICRIQT